jgi:hypothetical protein
MSGVRALAGAGGKVVDAVQGWSSRTGTAGGMTGSVT